MGSNAYGKLTPTFVSKHKKPGTYNDGGNLYLQIASPTAKSWVLIPMIPVNVLVF